MSALQKGAVAETAVDTLVLLQTGGRLRTARPICDDHGTDRVLYRIELDGASLFLQPKTAFTAQRGGLLEFRIPLWEIPRDPSRYFVLLTQLVEEPPWLGPSLWLIPGPELLKGRPDRKQRVVRVPVDASRPDPFARFRLRREDLGAALERAVGRARGAPGNKRGPGRLTESAAGRIGEDQLVCALTVQSRGRLVAWRVFADVAGLDLAVNFAGGGEFVGLQPKCVFNRDAHGLLLAHVAAKTFHPNPSSYLVIVEMDAPTQALGPFVWVVPCDRLPQLVRPTGDAFVFHVSPNPRSTKDNFLLFRHPIAELARTISTGLMVRACQGPNSALPGTRQECAIARQELAPGQGTIADLHDRAVPPDKRPPSPF